MFNAWVKNVYRVCIVSTINSVYTSTRLLNRVYKTIQHSVKQLTIPTFINTFTPQSYTPFFTNLYLLYTPLSTLSTSPIIKKNKENMKGSS